MGRKVISILLVLLMALGFITNLAYAAEFPFSDVVQTSWYYNDVKTAYDNGLISGYFR